MPDEIKENQELFKEAVKEAIREWLEAVFATFGKWTLTSLAAAAFGGLVYFVLIKLSWIKP